VQENITVLKLIFAKHGLPSVGRRAIEEIISLQMKQNGLSQNYKKPAACVMGFSMN